MIWITGAMLLSVSFGILDRNSILWEGAPKSATHAAARNEKVSIRSERDAIHPLDTSTHKNSANNIGTDPTTTAYTSTYQQKQRDPLINKRSVDAIGHAAEEEDNVENAPTPVLEATRMGPPSSFMEEKPERLDGAGGLRIPVALLVRSVSSQTATIVWDGGEAGGSYNLYICEDRSTHWSNCDSVDLDSNRAELDGLAPDSKYRLDVVSIDSDGRQSESSDVLYIETLAPGAEKVDIPAFDSDECLSVNSACYNDCANTYAIVVNQGGNFDLAACSRRCEL